MDITEKVYDGHVHTLMRVPVRESVEIFKKEFEELGVTKANFASCPLSTKAHTDMDKLQNIKCLYYKAVFSPNAYAFCDLDHDFDMPYEQKADFFLAQAKENLANGYDGYKILEGMPTCIKKTGFMIDDMVYDKLFGYLEEVGAPVLMHLGHPKYFWDPNKCSEYWKNRGCYYGEGTGYPDWLDIINSAFTLLDRHPNLKLTLAHFGFMGDDYDLAEKFMSYKNTMFDVTPGGEQILCMLRNPELKPKWYNFIIKYSDRIKYGTDLYNFDYTNEADWKRAFHMRPDFIRNVFEYDTEASYADEKFKGFKIPKEYRDKIYRENLIKELGDPTPINFDWALAKVKELRKEFSDTETLDGYDLMCMEHDFNSIKNAK